MPERELLRSFHGVRQVFRHCLVAALGSIESGQAVRGSDLAVGYKGLSAGDYALWFDIRDRRHRFTRWLTPKETWDAAVETLLGEASKELVSLLRAIAMGVYGSSEDLMIRPVPGPEGMQSRVEISLPGQPAARLASSLWTWSRGDVGAGAVRDMFAVLLGPGVASVDVVLYAGQPEEKSIRLDATPEFLTFIQGSDPSAQALD